MKTPVAAVCAALVAVAAAYPTRHYANDPVAVAPVALVKELAESLAPAAPASARAEREARDARRDARRKEWQDWAHQEGPNGMPNGSNFVMQILDGVSGIVDSALGPVYSVLGA
ncbi:hypothetical protein IWQ57_005616 [Coemansia nantahalensis]|uniref:Uncharacterized protein n=1 Tax=Coemansia nantahalensis TaxID=2789366 RepID=A0ACC1JME8_9FUNG|nr:hypothetical protein IWQ57_005616 [Coemansia nantahalensis]